MVRVTAEELDDGMFVDADGNVVDPAITPIVLMPDPKLRRTVGPWQLWIVTTDEAGSLPSEEEMGSFYEAEEACDAANARMGWIREEAGRVILASIVCGTA